MRGLGQLALPARFVLIKGFEICEPTTEPARMKNCERFHCFINSKRTEWAARDMGIHHRARPDERLREHPIRTPAAIAGSIPTEEGGIAPDRRGRDCRHDRTTIPRPENSRQRQMRGTARSIPIEKEGNTESGAKAAESRVKPFRDDEQKSHFPLEVSKVTFFTHWSGLPS